MEFTDVTARENLSNIVPIEASKRRNFGLFSAIVAVVWGLVLLSGGFAFWWNLTMVLPFWGAAQGLLQAREKT